MKRFQDCSSIEKIWRYRFYLILPFQFTYRLLFPKKVYQDEFIDGNIKQTNNFILPKGKELWGLLVGEAQIKMNWTYTTEEIINKIKKSKLSR